MRVCPIVPVPHHILLIKCDPQPVQLKISQLPAFNQNSGPKHLGVEPDRPVQVRDGEAKMVDSLDIHVW
ncbi:hypothetical protein D3C80_1920080 [compost metagenome]